MDHQASITESDLEHMLFDEAAEPKALPLSLLERITNGFSYKLEIGRGGFAVVYKAMLENGAVAIKRLSNTYMYEKEFFREVECLMKVKHQNIVRFLGYCVDTQGNMATYKGKLVMADIQQRLLCFEYLPNGGLDGYIKDPSGGLEWRYRFQIIKGICEGLHYLHQLNIVHLDLKPANILLDEDMVPKITDFGISRSFEEDQTRFIASKVVGTKGYMAPEFVSHVITQKYDLYSLGVIILEILTGEKGCQDVETVLKSWSGRLKISHRNQECEQIRVCAEIGIECTDFDPANRPVNMKHIIERLADTERTEKISHEIKILDMDITSFHRRMYSFDTNQAKQWIITGEDHGHIRIWNCQTHKKVYSFKLSEETAVTCVKFIARKEWFAAGSSHKGFSIHVYSYETKLQKITHIEGTFMCLSLAVHPTEPYLLSRDTLSTRLWNWDKNCTHTFQENNCTVEVCQDAFSSEGTIASASNECTIKVWSLDSSKSNYILYGHSDTVNCLAFFKIHDREYLVTGSDDLTAKIWDTQKRIYLYTLEFTSAVMSVFYQPDLCILIIGSQDGSVSLWRTTNSRIYPRPPRLERTVNTGDGAVRSLTCLMGRVVIGKEDAIAIMDIDCMNYWQESMDHTEPQLIKETRIDEDETSKVIDGSSSELPILDVHPLELWFPCEPNMSIPCPLQLTNDTDEHVAFRLVDKSGMSRRCLVELLPLYGIVPPKSTYTLTVTTEEKVINLSKGTVFDLVLQSSASGSRYIFLFISRSECDEFFEKAVEMGNTVHELILKAVYAPHGHTTPEVIAGSSSDLPILDVHPLELWFPCEPNMSIPCQLQLTNTTDEYVAFRLVDKSGKSRRCLVELLPLYGIVPPKSTYTLTVTTDEKVINLAEGTVFDLVLQSSASGDRYIFLFISRSECDEFFEEAVEMGNTVHEAMLKAVYAAHEHATHEPALIISREIKILSVKSTVQELCSIYAHPTESWIITGHANGVVQTWNHETKESVNSFKLSERSVCAIKLIARNKCIVAGTSDGFIHVFDCVRGTKIPKIRSFKCTGMSYSSLDSLDVHPVKPYVLSTTMELWHGIGNCKQRFNSAKVYRVAFNPKDANIFASAEKDGSMKIWKIGSHFSDSTLPGHSKSVNCLEFYTRDDVHYLITGSDDCTAKIWDLQKRECIHTLAVMSPVISVIPLPDRPCLVTGSKHGTVQLWSSTDFRLERTVHFGGGGPVRGLACLLDSRRVVIGQEKSITIIDIDKDAASTKNISSSSFNLLKIFSR